MERETVTQPSDDARNRVVVACGLLGPVLLLAYFFAPVFALPLAKVLYAAHPTSTAIVAAGERYHVLIRAGTWLQAVGSLLMIVFLLALGDKARRDRERARRTRGLAWSTLEVGAAVLLATVLVEAILSLTWANTAIDGHTGSSRTVFDLMSSFAQVYALIPAPTITLSLGILLVGSNMLPRAFARFALVLGAGFVLCGFVGVIVPAASAATGALGGAEAIWVLAAAIVLSRDHHPLKAPTRYASPLETEQQAPAALLGAVQQSGD
jgi:hypothetical protein